MAFLSLHDQDPSAVREMTENSLRVASERGGCLCGLVAEAEDLRGVRPHLDLPDLAGHGHREPVNDVDVAGHLVVRELALAERPNPLCRQRLCAGAHHDPGPVSYTHLRAHET